MKNRILSAVIIFTMVASVFVGCGTAVEKSKGTKASEESVVQVVEDANKPEVDGKYSVVCTIFPEYDWVKLVVGENIDNFELTLLLDNGVDLHSYQPTAEDIAKIAACDLFIYVGGESDEWVEDALAEATNEKMQVINLLDCLGDSIKEEELVEGMEGEDEEEEGEEEEEGPEYDEHVWLSLKNAEIIVDAVANAISEIDSANADIYESNSSEYISSLKELDSKYANAVEGANKKTLLFGDRFPFRYLVDDYGIEYFAAFVGCSAETEASFETITFLSGKVNELGLSHVMVIESSDKKIAETVIQNTKDKNQNVLVLDSMQSTTSNDIASGATYLGVMEKNLEVLSEALN